MKDSLPSHNIKDIHLFLENNYSDTTKIGFIGTIETCKTNLLKNYFEKKGKFELIYSDEEGKNNSYDAVHSLEYGIKTLSNPITRKAKRIFKEEIDKFIDVGVRCIILGCEDIYLALCQEKYCEKILLIDSAKVLEKY